MFAWIHMCSQSKGYIYMYIVLVLSWIHLSPQLLRPNNPSSNNSVTKPPMCNVTKPNFRSDLHRRVSPISLCSDCSRLPVNPITRHSGQKPSGAILGALCRRSI